ncbi:DNA polymerase I [Herbidospora sp. RD11066]
MPKTEETPRLLLLDGHSLAYRAFYALKDANLMTTDGQHTEAVYGFLSMLVNIMRDEAPSHLVVCFDRSEPTFRHEAFAAYKANRSETPEDFRGQMQLIYELLDVMKVPHLSLAGFEADDLIATLATRASGEGMDVLIVTGDRDALQLVDPKVTVLMTRRGISDMTRFTPDAVVEKYGLTPNQYPDFAALRGDPSDNLPSIPSVGEKTATKWISEFGSLDELVRRADEVKGKVGDKLREHLGQVIHNRMLTELKRDVAIDAEPASLVMGQWDREELNKILDSLQIRGELRERLFKVLGTAEPEVEGGFEAEIVTLEPGGLAAWLGTLASGRTALAFAGSWGAGTGRIDAIAFAAAGGTAAYLDLTRLTPDDEADLAAWLADESIEKAVHDSKGPLLGLWAQGYDLRGLTCDTALAAYLAMPGQRSFPLDDLVLRYLHRTLTNTAETNGQTSLFDDADDTAARDLAMKAVAVLDLAEALENHLSERGGTRLVTDVELPLVRVLAEVERNGIAADGDYFAALEAEFAAEVKFAVDAAHAAVGEQFNLGSPKQLQEIFFERLNLPKTKKIKTGYSTDADQLAWLATQTDHELPTIMLRHRDQQKLRTTVEGLIKEIADDGRIHTTFNQIVAATGRLSSEKPNLQNIPIRTSEGRRIRKGFVVGPGYETLLTADYSQIELRIMAHLSGDRSLVEAFESGHDFHAATAAKVFDTTPEAVTGEMRAKIKAMNYGLAYGLSDFGLSGQLNIPVAEARALKDEYFEEFGGIRDFLNAIVAQARTDGYTSTILGRRRYLPDLTSDNRQRREMAERMALNAPIQGSAADIIKVAMLNVQRAISGMQSRMLLQVHDELVFEVHPGELDDLRQVVVKEMAAAYELTVPLDVSVGVGSNWQDAGH